MKKQRFEVSRFGSAANQSQFVNECQPSHSRPKSTTPISQLRQQSFTPQQQIQSRQESFTHQSPQSFTPQQPQSRQSFKRPSPRSFTTQQPRSFTTQQPRSFTTQQQPQLRQQSFTTQQQTRSRQQSFTHQSSQSFTKPSQPRQLSTKPPQSFTKPQSTLKCKNVQVRKKNQEKIVNHNVTTTITNPYDVQDVDPLFEQYNFDVQGNLQRKFNPFPYCPAWTKRDVNEIFDNSDENPYEAGHFYALFHLLLGLPEINCQDQEALTRASKSLTERLELWQLGNQFDLVYYIKEQRIFRIHIDKKQIYEPTKLFPLRKNERSFPTIHDEDRMNLTTYCLFLKQKIDSKIKNLF